MNTQAAKNLFTRKTGVEFNEVRKNMFFYYEQKPAIFAAWTALDVLIEMQSNLDEYFNPISEEFEIKEYEIEIQAQAKEFFHALSKL